MIPAMFWYDLSTNGSCIGSLVFSVTLLKGGKIFLRCSVVGDLSEMQCVVLKGV